MRVGNFFGQRVVMTEAKWKACLARVDVKAAVAGSYKWYIHAPCPFCTVDGRMCRKCPLGSFKDKDYYAYGCLILINCVGKQDCVLEYRATTFLTLSDEHICWRAENDGDARAILQALYVRFKRMKKTLRRK